MQHLGIGSILTRAVVRTLSVGSLTISKSKSLEYQIQTKDEKSLKIELN